MTGYPISLGDADALVDRLAFLTALAINELPEDQRALLAEAMNAGRPIRVQRVEESLEVAIDGRVVLAVSIPALIGTLAATRRVRADV